jgi:hypothetical protein
VPGLLVREAARRADVIAGRRRSPSEPGQQSNANQHSSLRSRWSSSTSSRISSGSWSRCHVHSRRPASSTPAANAEVTGRARSSSVSRSWRASSGRGAQTRSPAGSVAPEVVLRFGQMRYDRATHSSTLCPLTGPRMLLPSAANSWITRPEVRTSAAPGWIGRLRPPNPSVKEPSE